MTRCIVYAGIDYACREVRLDDILIKMNLWDTVGQERYQSVTMRFYRDASAAVLVYDPCSTVSVDVSAELVVPSFCVLRWLCLYLRNRPSFRSLNGLILTAIQSNGRYIFSLSRILAKMIFCSGYAKVLDYAQQQHA